MGALLMTCGVVLAVAGTTSGYRNARLTMGAALRDGDPTRRAIDAARPVYARAAARRLVRGVGLSLAWLALAVYGLILASAGSTLTGFS